MNLSCDASIAQTMKWIKIPRFISTVNKCIIFKFFNEFAERNIQSKGKKEKKRKLKERLKKRRADENEQAGKRIRPEVNPEDNLPTYTSPELQWVRIESILEQAVKSVLEKFDSTADSRMGFDGWSTRHKTEKWKHFEIIASG